MKKMSMKIKSIALVIIIFFSTIKAQSVVLQENYDNRFTPQEIGLPENMPYVKSVIWGKEGVFR